MAAFAVPQDVEDRWRPLTPTEQAVAVTLLEDASDMIRERWPADDWIAAGSLNERSVRRVVAGMVKRAMMAGVEGVSQEQQSAGPFSQARTYANPSANLYLSAEDVRLFEGYPGAVRVGWAI